MMFVVILQLLDIETSDMVARLVSLKGILPGCNVAYLVQQQPRFFLEGSRESIHQRVAASVGALRAGLEGADVDAMVTHDPLILSLDVASGLLRLRELWPEEDVDAAALAASDPVELVLAIRALCNKVSLPVTYS
ncbi:MAG: hypothetical protein WDW38_005946 [Sanguina aurantia]